MSIERPVPMLVPGNTSPQQTLSAELTAAAERWGVRLDPAPPLRSPSGLVAFGRDGDGAQVVVKVAAPGSDEELGGAVLRHFGGNGSVRLLAWEGRATLQERIVPAQPLAELVHTGDDDAATTQLCATAAALHHAGMPSPETTGIAIPAFATVARWGQAFERYRRAGATLLPAALVDRAAELFAELEATQDATCLLHGDLQHYNVLRDERRGWLAIDPKGVIGEPAYELGALLRNPGDGPEASFADPRIIRRRVSIIHEMLGLNPARVLAWAFAQCVLSAVWSWEDRESPDQAIRVARAIEAAM
jgi:streptomycin 6-kinase